jgi:hypothetical protein
MLRQSEASQGREVAEKQLDRQQTSFSALQGFALGLYSQALKEIRPLSYAAVYACMRELRLTLGN